MSNVKILPTLVEHLPIPVSRRWKFLAAAGMNIAAAGIERGVNFWNTNVTIGAGFYINRGVTFEGKAAVTLGMKVAVGPEVMILTSTHDIGPTQWRAGNGVPRFQAVSVGDGSWIGARATLMPGVTIGRGCVIAAGSVVRSDCPDNTLWAGVPAILKRELDTAEKAASTAV